MLFDYFARRSTIYKELERKNNELRLKNKELIRRNIALAANNSVLIKMHPHLVELSGSSNPQKIITIIMDMYKHVKFLKQE